MKTKRKNVLGRGKDKGGERKVLRSSWDEFVSGEIQVGPGRFGFTLVYTPRKGGTSGYTQPRSFLCHVDTPS